MTEALPFQSIAMHARSQSRMFDMALARQLRDEYGASIHLYCSSSDKARFYEELNSDGLFASISVPPFLETAFQPAGDPERLYSEARDYERRLGSTINSLVMTNRHFGRGYSLGGFYHPRSRYSEASYPQIVNAYVSALRYWEDEFRRRDITFVLNGDKIAASASRMQGIPFRSMAGSRFQNYHYWAVNEYYDNPRFEAAFARATGESDIKLEAPYDAHLANRSRYQRSRSLWWMIKSMGMTGLKYVRQRLRSGSAPAGYYLRENLSYILRMRRDERRLASLATTKLDDLEGQRFVYFPLHIEPEAALQIISPEYFYQLSAIAALSRDLPAGVVLAVKEAFGAIGRRPRNFYEQILEFKNVVLLETMEMGLECVRRADAVATICGTAGFEGAALATPVVAFGRHNIYNLVPHVRTITDEATLADDLRWALEERHDVEALRRDGRRLLEAVVAGSFDMREYDYADVHSFDPAAVEAAHAALVSSFDTVSRPSFSA